MRPLLFLPWLCVVVMRTSLDAQNVGMFRGDAAHTGVYSGGGSSIVGVQWRVPTDGDVVSSPVIVGDVVYVGTGGGSLLALERASGKTRWTYAAGSPIHSSPAFADGRVFVASRDGGLHAVSARDGKRVWLVRTGTTLPFPWGHESGDKYVSSAVVVPGFVIFGAGDGYVYALDPARGTQRWRAKTEGRVRGTPAVANGSVYVGSFDGRVYAFDLATGRQRWRYDTEGAGLQSKQFGFDRRSVQSSPAVANGVVYVGARDGFLYAIDTNDGSLKWRFDHKISWVNSSPAVANGIVYAASSDGRFVQAVDAATGAERWRSTTAQSIVWSSPAITEKYVYYGDGVGRLHVADIATGRDLALFRTGANVFSSPAVDGDLVVFGSDDGSVYALRTSDQTPVHRLVFFDSTYAPIATVAAQDISRYFANRAYTIADAKALLAFLEARVADRAPSVVVFAIDAVPAEAVVPPLVTSLIRRYLDAGGKIVWTGLPPQIWPVAPGNRRGGLDQVQWDAPTELLGVSHSDALFDVRGVRVTAEGKRWGLSPRWRAAWGVAPAGVTTVLGLDEWGSRRAG